MPDPQPWVQAILSDADAIKAGQGLPSVYTPPPQPFLRRASGKTGGGVPTTVPEAQAGAQRQDDSWAGKLLASPVTGVERVYKGFGTLGRAFPGAGEDDRGWGVAPPEGPRPSRREIAGGLGDVIGGGMEASTALVPEALAKAPVKMGVGLLAGTGIGTGVYAAGKALGIAPEYIDLAAQGLGLAGGIAAGHVADSPELRTSLFSEAKRFMTEETGAVQLPKFLGAQRRGTGSVAFPELAGAKEPPPEIVPPRQSAQPELATPELAEVKALFPRMDAYGKPASRLTGPRILARLEAAPDVSPEAHAMLTQVASDVGTQRISPDELHARSQGEAFTPDRIVRRVRPLAEGEKQIPGAPLGVSNARQVRGLRERYLGGIEQGMAGRDWYHDTGESILFHANDDPARARLVAGDIAITSPATSVSANTGMGVKGHNMATANEAVPLDVAPVKVETGRFPTAMGKRVEELHAGGEGSLGLKRDPFAENMALGGGFHESQLSPGVDLLTPQSAVDDVHARMPPPPPVINVPKKTRAVHDIWDAELHGYVNPDGTPMRTGFGPAQHRFMDRQQDKIVATANQRAIGGHTNWDDLRSQAAGWTGAKVNAGDIDPAEAALSPADYFSKLYTQGSRETLPGASTGHMPELHEPDMEEYRQLLHDIMVRESGVYDPQMRDQIAAGYGGLTGRAFPGPGIFKGELTPGMQTQILTGSELVPGGPTGARQLDEGSRRIMNAAEATHGLGMGQDVSAWSRVLPAGSGAPRGLWDVTLPGGTLTNDQARAIIMRYPSASDMAIISTPDGVRLGNMDPETMRSITKMLGGRVKESGASLASERASGYMPNDWREHRVGQNFFDPIRTIGTSKFDAFAPKLFEGIRKADALFRGETGGRFTLSQMRDELLGTVAGEGWTGIERLAKKYAIPVSLLTFGLQQLGMSIPQAPEGATPPDAPATS